MVTLRPAAFIDRDGTVILEREYLADPDGVKLIPGNVETHLQLVNQERRRYAESHPDDIA